jgi:transcription elongation GreA/GreB family factor
MSRAFVKEIDDAPEVADRPISDAPNFVTSHGAAMIEREITSIEKKLAAAVSETDEQTLRRDLRYWLARRSTIQITQASDQPKAVTFGTEVVVKRRGRIVAIAIVGEDEADPAHNRLAWTAPLAQALLGAEPGEIVDFKAGGTEEMITVVSVKQLSGV